VAESIDANDNHYVKRFMAAQIYCHVRSSRGLRASALNAEFSGLNCQRAGITPKAGLILTPHVELLSFPSLTESKWNGFDAASPDIRRFRPLCHPDGGSKTELPTSRFSHVS
jgi:hypothetical protein